MSSARRLAALVSFVLPAACKYSGPSVALASSREDVPMVVILRQSAPIQVARARAALDLRCQPEQIEVHLISQVRLKTPPYDDPSEYQDIYHASGCNSSARYACWLSDELTGICVREPLDENVRPSGPASAPARAPSH